MVFAPLLRQENQHEIGNWKYFRSKAHKVIRSGWKFGTRDQTCGEVKHLWGRRWTGWVGLGEWEVQVRRRLEGKIRERNSIQLNNPQFTVFRTSIQGEVALSPYVAVAPNKHSWSWTPGIYEKIERVCRRRNMPIFPKSDLFWLSSLPREASGRNDNYRS